MEMIPINEHHFDWWNFQRNVILGGKLVEEWFEYNSKTNEEWLDIREL